MRRNKEYFAEWLSRTLAEREIAGGEVARALGVNDSVISRWKNGKTSPSLDSVMQLADYLKINPPVALAVTAGLMSEKQAGVTRLPLPEDTKRRSLIKGQIENIRGLTSDEKAKLMDVYEEMTKGAKDEHV